ncbi:hypothetical protein ABIE27_004685 [Paenibacillus sp. 4624]|uniref:hypothetical protein n=1 Tax=Paenibacillus sp. 4624 TaxID=3156453 RepID=UPI003D1D5128
MINVRVIKVPIDLDKRRNIVFCLRSFAELDELYGSKQTALISLQNGGLKHVRAWLWAGLIHEDEDLTVEDVGSFFINSSKELILEVTDTVLRAASLNLPETKPDNSNQATSETNEENAGWDWDWMYYMGTTLLGMTEVEFWRCTVRKLFALWEIHVRVNGLDQHENEKKPTAPPGYIDQFI